MVGILVCVGYFLFAMGLFFRDFAQKLVHTKFAVKDAENLSVSVIGLSGSATSISVSAMCLSMSIALKNSRFMFFKASASNLSNNYALFDINCSIKNFC